MQLWLIWWEIASRLRPAFSRTQAFLWFVASLAGMTIRSDMAGVTSLVRALGISGFYYDRMVDFFHSQAVDRTLLTKLWSATAIGFGIGYRINGRLVLIGDGIKVPKEGKKMPAVRLLHQESNSNSKPEYIMGHSCQGIALCCRALSSFCALPLAIRIHEGLVFTNRDTRTLFDKMLELVAALGITQPFYFLGDTYYACRKIVSSLAAQGHHVVTRVKSNAAACLPAPVPAKRKRGRPKKYGKKIRLKTLFGEQEAFIEASSPLPGEQHITIRYRSVDLLWQPMGKLVRFVLVCHPAFANTIYMTTDLELPPLDVIAAYGVRSKIESSFKQAIYTIGTFAYHFWMKAMSPIKRNSKNQYLHKTSDAYRQNVRRKMDAYHLHLQLGAIAQGILQYIALSAPALVWSSFGSWLRTIRPTVAPSEAVTARALRNTYSDFLLGKHQADSFAKFILDKIDPEQSTGLQLASG